MGPTSGRPGRGGNILGRRLTLPPHALPVVAFALVAAGLLAAAPLLARSLRADARLRAEAELGAIAELKARQIVQWRADQLRVLRFVASYPSVRLAAEAASRAGAPDRALATHVSQILGQLAALQAWRGIVLLSRGAEVTRWMVPGAVLQAPPALLDAALSSPEAAASDLRLDASDRPDLDAAVAVPDEVFLNLLLNAAQAIPEGHAAQNLITVEAGRTGDGAVSVRIRDTGVGTPPHALERIFEPFFTTKPHGVGTGLGLSIAHRIVADAGGRIEVETQVGDGTAFHVVLPAAHAAPPDEPPAPGPEPAAEGSPRRVRRGCVRPSSAPPRSDRAHGAPVKRLRSPRQHAA